MSVDRPVVARRPRRGVRGAVYLLLAALLALLPAPAVSAGPGTGEEIARALRESPVYVHPGFAVAVPAAEQRRIVRRIEATGLPIKVVLVPLVPGDAFGGDPRRLTAVVHDRLGGGDAVFLTTSDDGGNWLHGEEWPDDRRHQAFHAAAAVGHLEGMRGAGLAQRVLRAVDLVAEGDGRAVYEKATADIGEGTTAPPREEAAGQEAGPSPLWLLLGLPVLLLLGLSARPALRRRAASRRSLRSAPFASPRAVHAAARKADAAGVRARAEEEVVLLGEELGAREDSGPHMRQALDAYAAAGTVLDGARSLPDLAGVLALVAEAREALEALEQPSGGRAGTSAMPLCFFHPLHGRAVRRIRWRRLGSRTALRVAACRECAEAVREHRTPEVLTDRLDGRDVPYFEIPAERSLWSATGYGSLGGESLTARVRRGDFSRTTRLGKS